MRQVFVFGHDGANLFGAKTWESNTWNLRLRLPESWPRRRGRRARRKLFRRQRRVLCSEADVSVTAVTVAVDRRRRRRRLPVLLRWRRPVGLVVVVEKVTRRDAQGPEKLGHGRVSRRRVLQRPEIFDHVKAATDIALSIAIQIRIFVCGHRPKTKDLLE